MAKEITSENSAEDIGEARDVIDSGNDDNIDCGFIIADKQDPYSAIGGPNNLTTDLGIDGTISNETLKNHVDDTSYEVFTQGMASCRQSGHINKVRPQGSEGDDIEAVVLSQATQDGDSGGPMFIKESDTQAKIVGNIVGKAGFGYDVRGTTADTIERELGGYIY